MSDHQYLSLPDPPGGTRIELIAARLRGDWDEVDRILQPTQTPTQGGSIDMNTNTEQENTMSETTTDQPEVTCVNVGTEEEPVWLHEDGSVIDSRPANAGGEVAFEGHVDPRYVSEVEQAMAELGRYCEITEDGDIGRPLYVKNGDLDFLLEHVVKYHGLQRRGQDGVITDEEAHASALLDAQEILVDEGFIAFQTRNRLRKLGLLGAVSLDITPEGQWVQDMGHPTRPKIIFLAVDRNTPAFEPFWKANVREYMAVWFVPNSEWRERLDRHGMPVLNKQGEPVMQLVALDADGEPVAPRNGRIWCDDKWIPGYMGIVDWFASRSDAKTALRDLQRAVRTIGKPPVVADERDEMREELLDADAEYDRGRARFDARRSAGERTEPVDPFA